MAELNRAQRDFKLQAAKVAHQIKPNVPLSWMWLLEWASGLSIMPGTRGVTGPDGETKPGAHADE